jgi:hypothetical protein
MVAGGKVTGTMASGPVEVLRDVLALLSEELIPDSEDETLVLLLVLAPDNELEMPDSDELTGVTPAAASRDETLDARLVAAVLTVDWSLDKAEDSAVESVVEAPESAVESAEDTAVETAAAWPDSSAETIAVTASIRTPRAVRAEMSSMAEW